MPSERVQHQIDALLDEAEAAMRHEDWPTVAARARAALRLDGGNTDALAYLTAAEPNAESGIAIPTPISPPTTAAPAPPSQPISFANGRYRVKKFLGEGGKKRVYLAHDTLLDRAVAFALIKTEGLDDVGRQRITREAQAMGRLGSHPHMVCICCVHRPMSTR